MAIEEIYRDLIIPLKKEEVEVEYSLCQPGARAKDDDDDE